MKRILVTQRVEHAGGERRDALDQAWHDLLHACELAPILVPNHPSAAEHLLSASSFDGVLLTGGNDLVRYGGDAPERDRVESLVLRHALDAGLPVLGVCRGMQVLLEAAGVKLVPVEGHVQPRQEILIAGVAAPATVNSYHRLGCRDAGGTLEVWARAADGVVKAVRDRELPWVGIMWHPERMHPHRPEDVELFRSIFASPAAEPGP